MLPFRGHDFFCEIDDDYIVDEFNLCGLSSVIPRYEAALDTILDVEPSGCWGTEGVVLTLIGEVLVGGDWWMVENDIGQNTDLLNNMYVVHELT